MAFLCVPSDQTKAGTFLQKGFEFNSSINLDANLCSSDTGILIATINLGVISFLADSNALLSDWELFLNTTGGLSGVDLNLIEITTNSGSYTLAALGNIDGTPLRSLIKLDNSNASCLMIAGTVISCTSALACAGDEACLPLGLTCNPPCPGAGTCTRTITSSYVAWFPSIPSSVCSE